MSTARDLFAAARQDAPDAAQRADMFQKIAMTTGVAAAASLGPPVAAAATKATATAAGAGAGTALVVKLVSVGVVLGAAITGAAVVLTSPSRAAGSAPIARLATPHVADRVASGAKLGSTVVRHRDPTPPADDDDEEEEGEAVAPPVAHAVAVSEPAESDLAEEARLVTAARRALVAGDPARALSLVQTTRKLGARSLEPEELGLEARALRALGRADDAAATELVLKRRYPDSALAR